MLAYSHENHTYVIDPHYLTIRPLKKIWDQDKSKDKKIATALLMWLYHMYNPHSPYMNHRNQIKSVEIVSAVFPKEYVKSKLEELETALAKVSDNEVKEAVKLEFNSGVYDPSIEPGMEQAIAWYRSHLKQTPLWNAYEAYKEAMYNLSKIISDPTSAAAQIRTASQELDALPGKMEKMRQQAERDEAMTLKVAGDRHVKRSERLSSELKAKERITG